MSAPDTPCEAFSLNDMQSRIVRGESYLASGVGYRILGSMAGVLIPTAYHGLEKTGLYDFSLKSSFSQPSQRAPSIMFTRPSYYWKVVATMYLYLIAI